MLTFAIRRMLYAVPVLFVISFIIFGLLALSPASIQIPLTVPTEIRQKIIADMGIDQPFFIRYFYWCNQFFINEPLNFIEQMTGWQFGDGDRLRVISYYSRSPVVDLIVERLPQTLQVVGFAYLTGVLIAIPVGIYTAYRQYSAADQIGSLLAMVGFSLPTFVTGTVLIAVFAVWLQWFPMVYDTTLQCVDWETCMLSARQMVMPVMVLALFNAAQISRFMRASVIDNLGLDYVRTARAKGMTERVVVLRHVLRNSLIPVVTVIALGVPGVFGGAIITEQIFRVNGIGALLITGIQTSDLPLVQTVTFLFAVLIVLFNLIADILYGFLDPRIRYD